MITELANTLLTDIVNTTATEYIAVATGIMSVWFCRKENILVYPTGIVNVLIYIYLFFEAGMYANMGINAVFFVTSIYGWYNWARSTNGEQLRVTALSKKQTGVFSFLIIAITVALYFILKYFTSSEIPIPDSFTTAIFIVAMWLQAIKKLETWILWIIGDILMIPLSISMGLAFTGLQYLAFLFLAVSGYFEWRKSLNTNNQ